MNELYVGQYLKSINYITIIKIIRKIDEHHYEISYPNNDYDPLVLEKYHINRYYKSLTDKEYAKLL